MKRICIYLVLQLWLVLISNAYAAEATEDENSDLLKIDLAKPAEIQELNQSRQYVLNFINLPRITEEEEIVMVAKYYDYKEGYRKFFTTSPLSQDRGSATAKFQIYTEEQGGYFSIRLFYVTKNTKQNLYSRLSSPTYEPENEASEIMPSQALVRLKVKNTNTSNVNQVDMGLAYLFNSKISSSPVPLFMLNGYPYPFNKSYREAYMHPFLSKISLTFGIGLTDTTTASNEKLYFVGATIPIADGFSVLLGTTLASANQSALASWGLQMNTELLSKFLSQLSIQKPPSF